MFLRLLSSYLILLLFSISTPARAEEQDDAFTVPVGDLNVIAIRDAVGEVKPDLIPDMQRYPQFSGIFSRGPVPGIFRTYLFKTGDHLVLVDSGWGDEQDVKGRTLEILKSKGIRPEEITDVLLTHLDWDHIGGMTKNDAAVFPKAAVWIARPEYEAWINGDMQMRPEHARQRARTLSEIYKDRIHIFNFGEELLPGVTAIDASGHTPGHTAYEIGSGKDKLTIAGDLMHFSQVQLLRPDLSSRYDIDPCKAAQTRERILEEVSQKKGILAGMHFPAVSDVVKREDGGYMMREPRAR